MNWIGSREIGRRLFLGEELQLRSEKEKMLAGELYDLFDGDLVCARERARDLCQDLNASREKDHDARRRILRELFGKGGESVWMQQPFHCDYGSNIELGERVYFNFRDICNRRALIDVVAEVGLERQLAEAVLTSDEGTDAIKEAEGLSRRYRVDGVPFFVINNEITLSGARQPDKFLVAFRQALV